MFDPRLLRVGVEVSGQLRWYDGLQISAEIVKIANALQGEATVKISNMTKPVRDYILSETTPFNLNRIRKKVIVEAGRQSTGYYRLYEGDIVSAVPSQPPDIMITLKAQTCQWEKGNVVSRSTSAAAPLSAIAGQVAQDMGLRLMFEADDKNVSNYQFTGAAIKQVGMLGDMGNVNAYVDGDALVIKNTDKPLQGTSHILSMASGMIGIPERTEQGIKCTYLLNPQSRLGGQLTIKSEINPGTNGNYTIYKLTHSVANRDDQFYTIAEASRQGYLL